jgi:transporter family-2 protein
VTATPRISSALGPAFVVLAVVIGSLNALQARVNGELGFLTGDGYAAALISISSGFLVISTVMVFSPRGRRGLRLIARAVRARELAWWHVLGGVSGAYYAIAQTLTGVILGVALFSVAIVAGQTTTSLLMDRWGVGPGGRFPLTTPRLIGTGLVLVAVVVAVGGQVDADAPVLWAWMPLVAGAGMGWQLAVNGRVRVAAESILAATFLNFAIATVLLGSIVAVRFFLSGDLPAIPTNPLLYSGGVLGALFIAGSALVVKRIGVLVLGIAVVAGQLTGALAIDLILPSPLHPLTLVTVVGVAIAFVAVALSGWPSKTGR